SRLSLNSLPLSFEKISCFVQLPDKLFDLRKRWSANLLNKWRDIRVGLGRRRRLWVIRSRSSLPGSITAAPSPPAALPSPHYAHPTPAPLSQGTKSGKAQIAYEVALATYRAAVERRPGTPITLRQGARVSGVLVFGK